MYLLIYISLCLNRLQLIDANGLIRSSVRCLAFASSSTGLRLDHLRHLVEELALISYLKSRIRIGCYFTKLLSGLAGSSAWQNSLRLVKKFFAPTILLLLLLSMLLLQPSAASFEFLHPNWYIVGKGLAVVGRWQQTLRNACWVSLCFSSLYRTKSCCLLIHKVVAVKIQVVRESARLMCRREGSWCDSLLSVDNASCHCLIANIRGLTRLVVWALPCVGCRWCSL